MSVADEWGRLGEAAVGEAALAERLQRAGVVVHRTEVAPRDALIAIGPRLIEGSPRGRARQADRFAVRALLQRRGAHWPCVPPGWPNDVDGPWLEGGDVLLNGREIYVGMSGRASDMAGIDWLEGLLGDAHRVVPVAMRSEVGHLEDVLALVRPGLLICCPPLLIDGLPTALRGWTAIEIAPATARERGAHLVSLDERRALVHMERTAWALARHGIEAVPFPGALRSTYSALVRE